MSDNILGLVKAPLAHAQDILSSWGHDPERAILGINNPVESKVWGTILGKNYTPNMNQLGGATGAQKEQMAKSGINMGLAAPMYTIADTVAGAIGGSNAGSALSGVAGAAGEAGGQTGGSLGGETAGGGGAVVDGGYTTAASDSASVGGQAYAGSAPSSVNLSNAGGTMSSGGSSSLTGSPLVDSMLKQGGQAAATSLATKAFAPKQPSQPAIRTPAAMPDPMAQEQARRRKIMESMANRGRASTILTNSESAGLGG